MNLDTSNIENLINQGKFKESLVEINILQLKKKEDFKLLNLKGLAYLKLNEFENSINYFTKALLKKKKSFLTLFYRSAAFIEMGEYTKSLNDLLEAESINPQSHEISFNIGFVYSSLGKNDQAIEYYQRTLKLNKDYIPAKENLIKKLNEVNSIKDSENDITKSHVLINKFNFKYENYSKITDENIKSLFKVISKIITDKELSISQTQIFKKNNINLNCERHFKVFNNFEIIPKFCFSCFKVSIKFKNVIDLIKLYLVFDNVNFPNNNIKKCMIELRPKIEGNYKGFIYCSSLNEAKEIEHEIKKNIKNNIGNDFVIEIKRGCTEFSEKYPKYQNLENEIMNYDEDWINYEKIIDEKFPKFKVYNNNEKTIKGISLSDILVIKNWLYFAKISGDQSYRQVSEEDFTNNFLTDEFQKRVISIKR
tara:strand:- start:319 stop:1587 length:1269 start_codon:yes stop_codon:yes gene_type:complete